ncbi:MAG: inositol monophosphatase [Myxococcales bacterium]|nr:inositol monophosphatase [Myxococcales bacterium]
MPLLLSFAIEIAAEAGAVLMEHFEGDLEIATKSSPVDLVTTADKAAEALIVARIRARYPEHGILAEEGGNHAEGRMRWIVDPLDGTTNFAHAIPHFCVSIALWDEEGGRVGVVHDPVRGETFFARRGGGAFLESPRGPHRRLALRTGDDLGEALVATGFSYRRATDGAAGLREFTGLVPQLRGIRRAGSAALDLAYVAAGRLDGYWERHLSPWDTAAGAVLVQEAGGIVRRIDGGAWLPSEPSVVAANPRLLPRLVDALAAAGDPGR